MEEEESAAETVLIVDGLNRVTGTAPRPVMRRDRLPHRATYVALGDGEGRYLVERRTAAKDYCPGMLDACPGGVVRADEDDVALSAAREIYEELGARAELEFLGWRKLPLAPDSFVWAGVFRGEYRGKIVRQESEVAAVLRMTPEEIEARAAEFTPDSLLAFRYALSRGTAPEEDGPDPV